MTDATLDEQMQEATGAAAMSWRAHAHISAALTQSDARFLAQAREWVPDALKRIETIRKLHQPYDVTKPTDLDKVYVCQDCWNPWPCPTVIALDGVEQ